MRVSVRRISVWFDRGVDAFAVDLALPSHAPLGELIPDIVTLVGGHTAPDATACAWRLDRVSGGPLIESMSLADNDVHEGDLLFLVTEGVPPLGPTRREPCRDVASSELPDRAPTGSLPGVVCTLTAVMAAAALAAGGAEPTPVTLIIAAVGACAMAAATIATEHRTELGTATVALAAATGWLAVPSGGPAAPSAFLAAAAGFAACLVLQRLAGRPNPTLVAMATFSALVCVVTVASFPMDVVGAGLAVASLVVLALAPRMAVLAAGLGPEQWTDDMDARGAAGHAALTGLVGGCATGAGSGAALVALTAPSSVSAAFAAMTGIVLLLRIRTHVEPPRQMLLAVGGLVGCASSYVAILRTYPSHAGWAAGALIAVALCSGRRPDIGGAVARSIDRLELALLAMIIPTALWVGGAYQLVGTVSLP